MDAAGSRWQVRPVLAADQAAVRQLFLEAFGHEMTAAQYAWKYGSGPRQGRGDAYGVWEGDRLVAHYGGFPRRLCRGRTRIDAVQIGDVMVAPNRRGLLTRRGPFFHAATSYFSRQLAPAGGSAFAYGFPSKRHLDLGRRLGLYAGADRISAVSFRLDGAEPMPWRYATSRISALDPACAHAAALLAAKLAEDLAPLILVERSPSYLEFRYAGWGDYALHAVRHRLTRKILGFFVIRPTAPERWELLDLLARRRDLPLLLRAARSAAAAMGGTVLELWASAAPAAFLAELGGEVTTTDVEVAVSIWPDAAAAEETRGRFWLLSGDTDFR